MSAHAVEIIGITDPSYFPPNLSPDCCIETCETDKLFIPFNKPDILHLLSVAITISTCNFKVICTPIGKKLVIEAIKHIKVMYTAADNCQSVHTAHFNVPFCMFVLIKNSHYQIADIYTALEYVSLNKFDCRCLVVSALIFACPLFKHHCQCEESDHTVQYFCQSHTDTCESSCKTDTCSTCHNVKVQSPSSTCSTKYYSKCQSPGYYGQ